MVVLTGLVVSEGKAGDPKDTLSHEQLVTFLKVRMSRSSVSFSTKKKSGVLRIDDNIHHHSHPCAHLGLAPASTYFRYQSIQDPHIDHLYSLPCLGTCHFLRKHVPKHAIPVCLRSRYRHESEQEVYQLAGHVLRHAGNGIHLGPNHSSPAAASDLEIKSSDEKKIRSRVDIESGWHVSSA